MRMLWNAVLVLFLSAGSAAAGDQTVNLDVQEDKTVVTIGGQEFAVYQSAEDLPKPFLSPVRAADGTIITRPLENPEDHPHHKGIWLSVDEVNGIQFWAEKGKIKNVSVKPIVAEGNPAKLEVVNHWLGEDGKPVVTETTIISIFANRLMVYDIIFTAGEKQVTFGDTKEGLFGIRIANSMREREGGHVVNAEGLKGSKEAWGKPSKWVDYYGEIDGKTYGVTIFDYPTNFRPSRYHVRNYGLFSINPFGEKAYTNGVYPENPLVLEPGKKVRLRYGIYIHTGDTESADVPAVYEQFVKAAKEG